MIKKIAPFFAAFALMLTALTITGCDPIKTDSKTEKEIAKNPVKKLPVTISSRTVTKSGATIVTLSNGMTVIAKSVKTAPVVCVRSYVKCGGMNEGKWLGCGLSHLLEHLVAKEAIHAGNEKSEGSQMVDKRCRTALIGGQSNAYTTLDHTCYYIAAAASKTKQCIELIADQMAKPSITFADFTREHGVVQRELEMGKDNPSRIAMYANYNNLYAGHPASVPTIGFPAPLSKVTYKDIIDYHSIMYVPQNMIFTIVGDIDVEEAINHTVKQFQGFNKGRQPNITVPPVPEITGVRKVIKPSPKFREAQEYICFPSIKLQDKDLYALDVLSIALSSGRTSRMFRELVAKQRIVSTIDTYSSTPSWGKGAFITLFRCDPKKADAAEKAIFALYKDVVKNGITQAELDRAKRQLVAYHIKANQEMEDIASVLARDYMNTGDPDFSENYAHSIKKVTLEQVHAMAKKYFTFDKVAITRIVPGKVKLASKDNEKLQDQKVVQFTLRNGLKVILQPTKAVDLVSVSLAAKGGILLETPKNNGIGNMTMLLSGQGSEKYSTDKIEQFFDSAGGAIGGTCGDNTFIWESEVLGQYFPESLKIFADVVQNPTYPDQRVNLFKRILCSQIYKIDENWTSKLSKFFRKEFFAGTPWAMLRYGSIANVKSFSSSDLKAYHSKILNAKGSVLSVYGNFDAAKTRKQIEELFSSMPVKTVNVPTFAERKIKPNGETYILHDPNFKQAAIQVGFPAPLNTAKEEKLALLLADTLLSGYNLPSGPLHKELRGKKLVYVVHAYLKTGTIPGAFVVYSATQPEKGPEVLGIIEKNLANFLKSKPTKRQLDLAINTIITADALNSQKFSTLAMMNSLNTLYGLGLNWDKEKEAALRKITPEQVLSVYKKYYSKGLVKTVITPKPELFKGENIKVIAPAKKKISAK